MSILVYIDGQYYPKEVAKISVFDHGLLYGDGLFEGIRAYNGRVFALDEHVDRLYDCAKAILLEVPLTKSEMKEVIIDTCRRNDRRDAYIRVVVTRGYGDLGLDPRKCPKATVICIADKIKLYPEEMYRDGLTVVTVAQRRNIVEGVNPRIKSLNYLNNILGKIEANLAGVGEAIMLNNDGYVAECTGDNIFVVKDGVALTPPSYLGALHGITRATIMKLMADQGCVVREQPFTRFEVYTADEVFLTGTAAEVIPVVKVDGRTIADGKPGPLSKKVIESYRAYVSNHGTEI
ncbi:MAG: branched-chain-amino-acid transaminase [Bacillota bacterium]